MAFNEEVDMLLIFGECKRNARAAATLYALRFPNMRHPSHMAFTRLERRSRELGFGTHKRNKQHPVTNDDTTIDVLAAVEANPHVSIRDIVRDSGGVSKSSVGRILKQSRYHPYHISLHQELTQNDFNRRVEFCTWLQTKIQHNPDFLTKVLFSDEATFQSTGQLNRHNCHYWSAQNPHWMRTVDHQRKWSLNVWCGIYNGKIVGPHFFEGNLNGEMYEKFLRTHLPNLLEEAVIDPDEEEEMWLQQDGAPPHYAVRARTAADELFPDRWMGRGGPAAWPARSPDLTPLDLFCGEL